MKYFQGKIQETTDWSSIYKFGLWRKMCLDLDTQQAYFRLLMK